MSKKQIVGLVVAVALFIVTGISSVLTQSMAQKMLQNTPALTDVTDVLRSAQNKLPTQPYVAVVNVIGEIQEEIEDPFGFQQTVGYRHTTTMNMINDLMMDDNNRGIFLYIDSPGGAVYESLEMYNKLMEYKQLTGRPVWCYMAHYAASGGYMIAMAADHIGANISTTTGSIGVIMSGYDLTGLYEKLGIRYVSITSGANKDSSTLSDEQIAIFQEQVDECYTQFVDIVAQGRGMTPAAVRSLADGRVYTATQALKNGLIDEVASYESFEQWVCSEAETDLFYEPSTPENVLYSLLSGVAGSLPKSDTQALLEAAEKFESGVPMYYAQQLQ